MDVTPKFTRPDLDILSLKRVVCKNIANLTFAIVQVAIKFPEPNSGSDVVTVRGPKEDVEKATKLLKEMSEEKQLSGVTMEIRAKPQHHKFLVGNAGIHIQQIKDDTGAR